MANSNSNSEVQITLTVVSRMWDCITGFGIYMTHAEIEEALLCAFEQEPCSRVKDREEA